MSALHPRASFPFVAPPPQLTPAGPAALDPVEAASVVRAGPDGILLDVRTAACRTGTLRLRPTMGRAVRVTLRMAGVPATSRVQLVEPAEYAGGAAGTGTRAVTRADRAVVLDLPGARLRVALEPWAMELTDSRGRVVRQATDVRDSSGALTVLPLGVTELSDGGLAYHDSWFAEPDEHFYGLGERFTGLDLRGQQIDCWIQDSMGSTGTRSYKASPFLISSRGYAVLVDTTAAASFDLAHSNVGAWSMTVPDEVLDYYLITGTPGECLTAYRDLTGAALLPPKWAFGPWISGGFVPDTAERVRERARQIREHRFPCDVLHLDTYWQPHGCWSDMRWDTDAFPDPRGLVSDLTAQGFRTSLWMNSYLGVDSPYYAQAEKNGWFLRTRAGGTWVGQLWGGHHPDTALLDLTHPGAVAWFKDRIRDALRSGAAVIKTDFGEAVPADAVAHNGMTGERLHNLYPLLYNDMVAEATREAVGGTGLTWGRSSWTGGQRHGAKWTGDPDSSRQDLAATLRAGLSLGLTGHPFWSHDIGGFHGTPTPELFVRWAQFGLLSPLSRFHGMTSRMPWDFGPEAYAAVLHIARLRMALLPCLYSAAAEAARTGEPLARPMVLDHPDRPDAHGADLQYLLGPDLLVAPFYGEGGRRPVWFPPGEWLPYSGDGAGITGPAWHDVELPLATAPLWIRAGALLLLTAPADRAGDEPFEEVTAVWARPGDTARTFLHDVGGARTAVSATLHGDRLWVRTQEYGPERPGRELASRLRIALLGFSGPPVTAELDGVRTEVVRVDRLDADALGGPDGSAR
ncbi:alpha-xylosidase [Streptomyces sp. NPDC052236]|uniref:alpha-xylosidase n=1 Tax=Streptomyces sp. NPDC052236 TaxID=3365686 RepID=UPI0037D06FBA